MLKTLPFTSKDQQQYHLGPASPTIHSLLSLYAASLAEAHDRRQVVTVGRQLAGLLPQAASLAAK